MVIKQREVLTPLLSEDESRAADSYFPLDVAY